MEAESAPLSAAERQRLLLEISDDVLGHGPIERFLADDTVTEIMVNSDQPIYVERNGLLERTESRFVSAGSPAPGDRAHRQPGRPAHRRVVAHGRRPPADGSRVNAIIPPLAVDGPVLTIRKFAASPTRWPTSIKFGTLSPRTCQPPVRPASTGKLNILVTGGTGTGKTTMLNVLSSFIPDNERVVTIEDAVELQLRQHHVVRLESPPAQHRGQGRGRHPRPGTQRAAHATRPHHRGRGPRRRGARHAPGHEHRPRGLDLDRARQLARVTRWPASRRWCSWRASTCRPGPSGSRWPRPSTSSSTSPGCATAAGGSPR